MQLVSRLPGSTQVLCGHGKGRGAPQVEPDAYRLFSVRSTTDCDRGRYQNRASLPGTLWRLRQGARSLYRRNLKLGTGCYPDDCEVQHQPSPSHDVLPGLRDYRTRATARPPLRSHTDIYLPGTNEAGFVIVGRAHGDTLELLVRVFETAAADDKEAVLLDHVN